MVLGLTKSEVPRFWKETEGQVVQIPIWCDVWALPTNPHQVYMQAILDHTNDKEITISSFIGYFTFTLIALTLLKVETMNSPENGHLLSI